jgi:iron(III) transport system substrate-binding protein
VTKTTRTGYAAAAAAVLAAAAIAGQPGLAAAQDGTLRIYSAYPDEHMAALVEGFEAKHPDVDVQVSVQPGEQLLSTLELELRANNPQADVVGLNQASIAALAKSHDAFAAYEPEGIEGIRESVRDPQSLSVPACVNIYLLQYNTNSIAEADAPETWRDLLDPKWRNQIAMADPASSQSIHSLIWFITEYLPSQGEEGFGWDYFKQLGGNAVRLEWREAGLAGQPEVITRLPNCELAFAGQPVSRELHRIQCGSPGREGMTESGREPELPEIGCEQ